MDLEVINNIIDSLAKRYTSQKYITVDELLDALDEYSVPITKTDYIAQELSGKGIKLFDHCPTAEELEPKPDSGDEADYAQIDYEEVFREVIKMDPGLETLINYVREIVPAQHGESAYIIAHKEDYPHAEQRLFEMNMRAAIRIALNEVKKEEGELADFVQWGFLGILIAIQKYDIEKNATFAAYCSSWIYQSISRANTFRENGCYFPAHASEAIKQIIPIVNEHYCTECSGLDLFCPNLVSAVMHKLHISADEATEMISYFQKCQSIEEIAESSELESKFLSDHGSYEDFMLEKAHAIHLKKVVRLRLEKLKDKERQVIEMRYGLINEKEMTLEECGVYLGGVTRERIRQIEKRGLDKIRKSLTVRGYPAVF